MHWLSRCAASPQATSSRLTIVATHGPSRTIETHCTLDALERIIAENDDQLIVFSEHLPTLKLIHHRVRDLGRPAIVY
jgi:hypothetical protein